ncbi:hypothetical protein [Chitinimonas koreensis]|uniref:hypothetical protein n=1 Tax=Chitinimonas koreensis TaxID=356302 RepID=UPI00041ABB3E|nr:hypothetical protein [Chitinimonas koreensis]QNM95498.1 hypothetical protein H9L41_16730 [Chitinimonas koreensis]
MTYQIREFPEVFCDACLRAPTGELLLLSCYGRDGALQQMLAAFTLPATQGGVGELTLDPAMPETGGRVVKVPIGNPERQDKHMGRLPATLFGQLNHMWLYDTRLAQLDRANRSAWLLWPAPAPTARDVASAVWATIKQLSPLPLLDEWRQPVLEAVGAANLTWMKRTSYPPLGRLAALHLVLPEDFAERVSRLIKQGVIGLDSTPVPTDHCLIEHLVT